MFYTSYSTYYDRGDKICIYIHTVHKRTTKHA